MNIRERHVLQSALAILNQEQGKLFASKALAGDTFNARWEPGGHTYDRWAVVTRAAHELRSIIDWPTARIYDEKGNRA